MPPLRDDAMVHPDGSGLTQLTSGDGADQNPAWTPN
jgi:Tol biopolymer transport system component